MLGFGLALLTILIAQGVLTIFPSIGWNILGVLYITIFTFQIAFYYLTTNFRLSWTILSFVLNFVLWTTEQVIIERTFHDSFIYQGGDWKLGVYILGGFLWVTNKIILDKLISLKKSIHKQTSILHV